MTELQQQCMTQLQSNIAKLECVLDSLSSASLGKLEALIVSAGRAGTFESEFEATLNALAMYGLMALQLRRCLAAPSSDVH